MQADASGLLSAHIAFYRVVTSIGTVNSYRTQIGYYLYLSDH